MITIITEMLSNPWEILALYIGMPIGFAISVFLHEVGHYLAMILYKGKPRFGYCGRWFNFIPFVTSAYGDDFYWSLYNRDRSTAWRKQLVISGSGLLVSFLLGAILSKASILAAHSDLPFVYCVVSGGLGIFNMLLFLLNLVSSKPNSDGYKVIKALCYREGFVDYLEDIDYQFTPEHLKLEVQRFQK